MFTLCQVYAETFLRRINEIERPKKAKEKESKNLKTKTKSPS